MAAKSPDEFQGSGDFVIGRVIRLLGLADIHCLLRHKWPSPASVRGRSVLSRWGNPRRRRMAWRLVNWAGGGTARRSRRRGNRYRRGHGVGSVRRRAYHRDTFRSRRGKTRGNTLHPLTRGNSPSRMSLPPDPHRYSTVEGHDAVVASIETDGRLHGHVPGHFTGTTASPSGPSCSAAPSSPATGAAGTPGRIRLDPHPDAGAAVNALARLARTKRRRGYQNRAP